MTAPIRAIYEDGKLRPLEPLDLTEGQEVRIVVSSSEDSVVAALGELVVDRNPADLPEIDEEALQREIDGACQGIPPVSEALIEERRVGS